MFYVILQQYFHEKGLPYVATLVFIILKLILSFYQFFNQKPVTLGIVYR